MIDAVSLLEHAPSGVRRFAFGIAAGRGPLGRVSDAIRFPYSARDVPSTPPISAALTRLLIGPVNSAGQAFRWAEAVRQAWPDVGAIAMQGNRPGAFAPPVDLSVPVAVYLRSEAWHAAFASYLEKQTHIIWESGSPLLGRASPDPGVEIAELGARGVHGALIFHGSDIRPPHRHAEASRWSPFRDAGGPVRALTETAAANAALIERAQVPVFVSTPDLLEWVPQATWCPVAIDPAPWRGIASTRTPAAGRPVVAHAPTQRWLKGTDHIEPMLRRLDAEGVIEYRRIEAIPHASMPAFLSGADIVLDQFLLGSYGVAACEALAAGRLVMGHVDDATRERVREATGFDIPVHEATVESLEAELRRASADPAAFDAARAAGPSFVDAVHDGRRSAAALAPFLGLTA